MISAQIAPETRKLRQNEKQIFLFRAAHVFFTFSLGFISPVSSAWKWEDNISGYESTPEYLGIPLIIYISIKKKNKKIPDSEA